MNPRQRTAGTTLLEVLVVIVVFLVGILAVVQIFPKGFQLLIVTRNNAVATALGRDEVERLKSRPDQMPEQILAVRQVGSALIADPGLSTDNLAPTGQSIANNGNLVSSEGTNVGPWMLNSGANIARRVIGEGRRVPSPRAFGTQFGGLLTLNFGPVDTRGVLAVYANDLSFSTRPPRNVTLKGPVVVSSAVNTFAASYVNTEDAVAPFEGFILEPERSSAYLLVPSSQTARSYRVSVTATLVNASGSREREFVDLQLQVPALTTADLNVAGDYPPLVRVSIADLLAATPGALDAFETVGSVEVDTLRLAPEYRSIAPAATFTSDPFEYKLLDSQLGVLLFNPAGYSSTITRPEGVREPLQARVNYDVLDWRIIREEFRVSGTGTETKLQLALQSLKVDGNSGPDGRPQVAPAALSGEVGHFALIDVETGGRIVEKATDGTRLVTVDKSQGIVTLRSSAPVTGQIQPGFILLPGETTATQYDLNGRLVRALYMARNEWSVQVLKAASKFSLVAVRPGQGQSYVGGSGAIGGVGTRLYFPASDANRKVTVGTIYYRRGTDASTAPPRELSGQDFVIEYPRPTDGLNLPCIDIRDIDPDAASFAFDYGVPARAVKGASVAVRAMWNPANFGLGSDGARNLLSAQAWGREWRKSTTDTYLQREEAR